MMVNPSSPFYRWRFFYTSTGGILSCTLLPTFLSLPTKVCCYYIIITVSCIFCCRRRSKTSIYALTFFFLLPLLSTFLLLFTSLSSGFYLPYPPTAFGWELSFIFLYAVVEMIRLFQGWLSVFFFLLFFFLFLRSKHTGSPLSSFFLSTTRAASKGNKTEQNTPLVWSLLLAISVGIAHGYYIGMQTYVMRVDVILNVVSFSFLGLEFMLTLFAFVMFSRSVS